MPTDRRAAALIVAAAVLWGTTGTAQALGPDGLQPLAVGSARLLVGGAGLVVLSGVRGRRPWRGRWPGGLTALTAAAIAAYQVTFFGAVRLSGVAAGTLVAIGSGPVFGGLLDRVVQGRRLGARWAAATALAVAGAGLIVVAGAVRLDPWGVALALGAGCSYAVYALGIKRLAAAQHPDDVVVVVFALGGVALVPVLAVVGLGPLVSLGGLAVVAHLGLVTVTLSYLLFGRGVTGVDVGVATTLSLAEPVTAALLGVVVLDERLSGPQWVGVAVVLGGLALLTVPVRARPRRRRPAASAGPGSTASGTGLRRLGRTRGRPPPR